MSILGGDPASSRQIAVSVQKLSVAFPQMTADFFNLLAERIAKKGFTSKRLEYAVNRVIDNFTYKQLTIADIMSSDLKCRVMSYAEMCNEAAKFGGSTDDYAPIRIQGSEKPAWVAKVDKAKYNLPEELI